MWSPYALHFLGKPPAGHKWRSRHLLGRLVGAEERSAEASARKAQSEFEDPTLPRVPKGAQAETTCCLTAYNASSTSLRVPVFSRIRAR